MTNLQAALNETNWWDRLIYMHRAWDDYNNGVGAVPPVGDTQPRYDIVEYKKDLLSRSMRGFMDGRTVDFFCLKRQKFLICAEMGCIFNDKFGKKNIKQDVNIENECER